MVYCSLREITYSNLGAENDCLATKYILAVTSFWKTDFLKLQLLINVLLTARVPQNATEP